MPKLKYLNHYIISRNLSYIERCRYTQSIKLNDRECMNLLPDSKFLLHSGRKSFLKVKTDPIKSSSVLRELKWFSYPDLSNQDLRAHLSTNVFLDVDEKKVPRFGMQLGKLSSYAQEAFERRNEGAFTDLRAAMFLLSWNEAQLVSRANALFMFNKNNVFCGKCGSKTDRNVTGSSRLCTNCEAYIYPTLNPVGIVLVTDPPRENAVLVRQPKSPPGMFTCVAGFADAGECLEETVKREVAEEVGLEVQDVNYVASQHWPFPGSLMTGCYAVAEKKELHLDSKELEDGKWFSREEIKDAINRVEANPFLLINRKATPDDGVFIPPPGAIAHHLILHWYKNTPMKDVHRYIK